MPGLIQELTTAEGFNQCFEVGDRSATIRSPYDWTWCGGTTIAVAVGRMGDMVKFIAFEFFHMGKTLMALAAGRPASVATFPACSTSRR